MTLLRPGTESHPCVSAWHMLGTEQIFQWRSRRELLQSSAQVKSHTTAAEETHRRALGRSEPDGRGFLKPWETTGAVSVGEVPGWVREGESVCV